MQSGILTINNPTNNVTVTITALRKWSITNTSLTGLTPNAGNPTYIVQNKTATLTYTLDSGYLFPATVTVTGATSSWSTSGTTGTLVISNPNGAVTITITAIQQLPAPTITMSGGVISFDPITGADTYQVFAGNTSIGEVSA